MPILTISITNIIFYVAAPALYVVHLSHKFSTKLARDCFKSYSKKSHKYDKYAKCLF